MEWHNPILSSARCLCHATSKFRGQSCPNCGVNGANFMAHFIRNHGDDLLKELQKKPRCEVVEDFSRAALEIDIAAAMAELRAGATVS